MAKSVLLQIKLQILDYTYFVEIKFMRFEYNSEHKYSLLEFIFSYNNSMKLVYLIDI